MSGLAGSNSTHINIIVNQGGSSFHLTTNTIVPDDIGHETSDRSVILSSHNLRFIYTIYIYYYIIFLYAYIYALGHNSRKRNHALLLYISIFIIFFFSFRLSILLFLYYRKAFILYYYFFISSLPASLCVITVY